MASAQDLLTSLKTFYPYIDTQNTNLTNELGRRAGQGATPDQILNDAGGYSEVTSGAQKQAQNQFNPAYQTALNNLDLQGQDLNNQENSVNFNYDQLGQTLQDQAKNAQSGFEERQNQLGLLPSGGTGTGLGKIASDLVKNQANAAQQKASSLASLALQRSNLGLQKGALSTGYATDVNNAVQQLLQGSQQALGQNNQAKQQFDFSKLQAIPGIYNSLFGGATPLPENLYNAIVQKLQTSLG